MALHEIASRICDKYKKRHPHRTMWPAGVGHQPLNVFTCGDDEALEFEEHCFSISCAERENYKWPCARCGMRQEDHEHMITNPPAGACEYEPAARPS